MTARATRYAWLVGYVMFLASMTWATLYARERVVARMSTPQERQRWRT